MRKLLMTAVSVLRSGQPFQADWAEQARKEQAQKARQESPVTAT